MQGDEDLPSSIANISSFKYNLNTGRLVVSTKGRSAELAFYDGKILPVIEQPKYSGVPSKPQIPSCDWVALSKEKAYSGL